ncbi:hypothetical protein COLO4_02318 [Corchorus olitorius]|uniref:DUF3108 domain-containing protein n=1 Tax=Corchorus olitorius TaxID=93759 RepID=A0A1R3L1A5_9ROSI|nr:hypothetical protein COLO4_02318 [Corchorus olitorius]
MANGRPCYKVVVNGRTTGVTDWVTRVRDTWASHIDNEESVVIWVSNDANKIPIRVEIGLKIGALALDLRSYSGLKQDLKFANN